MRALALGAALCALFLRVTPAHAQPGAATPAAWDPARTWVFAVGILEWRDRASYPGFAARDRRDVELMDTLRDRGVPPDHVVYLADARATRARILAELDAQLARTRPGDTLWFYYAGHGAQDDAGVGYIVPYDTRGALERAALAIPALVARIDRGFHGDRVLLTADACYSGAFADAARARRGAISYAALTSVVSDALSTGNWTFTEILLAALRGDARMDTDHDGAISLRELARFSEGELAYREEQLPAFAASPGFPEGTALAATSGAPAGDVGRHVEVEWHGRWWRAAILAVRAGRFHVRYAGYMDDADEWVDAARVRPPSPVALPTHTPLEIEWQGRWYPGTALVERAGLYRVRYDGYPADDDEWVPPRRLRVPAP